MSIGYQKAVFTEIIVWTSRGTHWNDTIQSFWIAITHMSYFNKVLCNARKKLKIHHILICYFSSFFGTVYHNLDDKLHVGWLLFNEIVHIWIRYIMQYCNLESCLKWLDGWMYAFHCYYEYWLHQYRRKVCHCCSRLFGNIWFLSWKSLFAVICNYNWQKTLKKAKCKIKIKLATTLWIAITHIVCCSKQWTILLPDLIIVLN